MKKPSAETPVSQAIGEMIDKACVDLYGEGFRSHLGASEIGSDCSRASWYKFRWLKKEVFSARMLRLFDRGHREEVRICDWLRQAGFVVNDLDHPVLYLNTQTDTYIWEYSCNAGKFGYIDTEKFTVVTGLDAHELEALTRGVIKPKAKQFNFASELCGSHFGGSVDAVGFMPPAFEFNEKILFEFKTCGKGSKFTNVALNGVEIARPIHYSQMCVYGKNLGIRYAVYIMINKNDDDMYCEFVNLDWTLAEQLEQKAFNIITAAKPPARISMSPSHNGCMFCTFSDICHGNGVPEINCRSCRFLTPHGEATWACDKYPAATMDKNRFLEFPTLCKQYERIV